MQLQDIQEQVDQWIKTYGVRYFDEMTNTLLLTEELGEFSRLIARVYGEQSFKASKLPIDSKAAISDELGDILFVLICLANQMDIDLTAVMENNLAKKTQRDDKRHKNNPKLQ